MTATTLRNQAMNSETRLASKLIQITRDLTAAGAPTDVAYTGVGFTPTSIICNYGVDSSIHVGNSLVDSSKTGKTIWGDAPNFYYQAHFIFSSSSGGNYQIADIKSFDTDGFTLTWTKTGSPTGTLLINCLCFR